MVRSKAISFEAFLLDQQYRIKKAFLDADIAQADEAIEDPIGMRHMRVQTRGSCGLLGQKRKDLSALDGTYDG